MLKGKTAVVTGAGQGIGRSIALKLAEHGADVVISDVMAEGANRVAEEVEALGRRALVVLCDVSKLDQCENLVSKAIEHFSCIDIMVNNAGITRDNLLMRMSEEDWDKVISINLKGVFNCCKSVCRLMMKQRSGRIINVASIVGLAGNIGQVNYAASKAGVIGITKTLAREFASRNINVNAVAPGFIQTAMTENLPEEAKRELMNRIPFQRLGEAEDVANAVLYLASPLASYVTGVALRVDGGMAI